MTSEQLIDNALRLHQVGNLGEAEAIYRQVLERDPQNATALHLLGVLASQLGQNDIALNLIRQSIAIYPTAPEVHNNLGNILRQARRIDDAIAAYRQALSLKADFAEAHNNLGLALGEIAEHDAAIDAFRQATGLRPDYAEAWNNLGNALYSKGESSEAIACFRKALELRPGYPDALNNLGNVHFNLSIALRKNGELQHSIRECRQAVALRPAFAEASNNLGILLQEQGDLHEAIAAFERALAVRPDYAEAHSNLANALRRAGRLKEAVAGYRRAVTLRPEYAEAHNNLGVALQQAGRFAEAISSFRRALELRPDLAEAHNNLGNVFKDQGELDEALACYQRAAALAPHDAAADSNHVYTLHFHPDYSAEKILEEHRKWNQRHAAPLGRVIRPFDNDLSTPGPRRLRIGYVSPFFRDHCQALFTLPLLSHHDRQAFEIFCYSDVAIPDAITTRLQASVDAWRNIVGMTDPQVADLIRKEQIDILVDLTVHMAHNRLLVFARRPAPVQVTWLGYPGTTGMDAMDYRLSDPYLDPPSTSSGQAPGLDGQPGPRDRFYSEQTIRLPDSFWCYDPLTDAPAVNELPALRTGFITFGCLNNFCKVTTRTLKLWSQVLLAVPDSRLLVLVPRGAARERLLENLQREGVGPTRIEFADRQPRQAYLELYHRIDLGLDTFPYNGHTTTLDSLWMGVPVVTIVGRTAVARGGWSQLSNLGLTDLAARSDKQFVKIARELASDTERLSRLRSTLRQRLTRSPLMDAPRFAKNLEATYQQLWRQWIAERTRPMPIPA